MSVLTIGLLGVIAFIFVFGLMMHWRSTSQTTPRPRAANFARATPNLLTTTGVFGTFVGILVGLQHFDVTNVDESVPLLLDGLKTAFWTSVAGLGAAIAFKLPQSLLIPKTSESPTDPIDLLQAMHTEAKNQTKALVGEEDASLITQLIKLRTSFTDHSQDQRQSIESGFERQIEAFTKFAAEMAENNSKALIEALNDVIKDFNDKLTEQFGENFKELNVAVGRLLEWQENYKQHIETSETRLSQITQEIEKTSAHLTQASNAMEKMPEQARKTAEITDRLNSQIAIAADLSMGVQTLRESLQQAMPQINTNIDQLTSQFSEHVKKSSDDIKLSADTANKHFETASAQLSDGTQRLENLTNELFEAFNKSMQGELERALSLMGKQLASISEKLASDYSSVAHSLGETMNRNGAS